MNENALQFDWLFGLLWLLTTAVGLLVGGMLAFASVWSTVGPVESALGETVATLVAGGLFGAFFALSVSAGPGLLLQIRGVRAGRWLLASVVAGTIGMAAGMTAAFTLLDVEAMPQAVTGIFIGLSLGLPVGIGQWLVLREHGLAANEWPLINLVAFLAGMVIGLPLGGEGREWLSLGVIGLVVGAITALGMVWLLRRPVVLAA